MNDNPAGEVRPMIHRKPPQGHGNLECKPQVTGGGSLTGGSRPSDACRMQPTDALLTFGSRQTGNPGSLTKPFKE
jgi:hypothetical protein